MAEQRAKRATGPSALVRLWEQGPATSVEHRPKFREVAELSAATGVMVEELRDLIESGAIEGIELDGTLLSTEAAVRRYLENSAT